MWVRIGKRDYCVIVIIFHIVDFFFWWAVVFVRFGSFSRYILLLWWLFLNFFKFSFIYLLLGVNVWLNFPISGIRTKGLEVIVVWFMVWLGRSLRSGHCLQNCTAIHQVRVWSTYVKGWHGEIWWKDQLWLVAGSSQGCVEAIWVTKGFEWSAFGKWLWLRC